jgi:hypothetical protein
MQGDDFRRTELLKDAPSVETRAADWLEKLRERGWLDARAEPADDVLPTAEQ